MRKILILALIIVHIKLPAQVNLMVKLPPVGITQRSQLWNLSLLNSSTGNINVRIELLLIEASTNQKILSGTSKILTLSRGLTMITANTLVPVSYNVFNNGYNLSTGQGDFIPVGNYRVCYNVVQIIADALVNSAEECEVIEVEPVSPPMLVSPSDNEDLDVKHPIFNWLPPSPPQLFNNLRYDFVLVQINNLQTASDAIQNNIPLQFQSNFASTTLQYSPSLPLLETGKLYAWQVTAKSNNFPIAKSEIWAFRIQNDKATVQKNELEFYIRVKQQLDASYALCKGVLKLAYLNESADKEVAMKIYDVTNSQKKEVTLDSNYLSVAYGENFKQLDFSNVGDFVDKHVYVLELVNSKNESWFLKFEFRQPN